jgi:hypothetical protein
MRVPVKTGSTFERGTPEKVFDAKSLVRQRVEALGRLYDVSADGQRFLMTTEDQRGRRAPALGSDRSRAKLARGAEAPRADEVIAADVTHSRPEPRLVTISREVFTDSRKILAAGLLLLTDALPMLRPLAISRLLSCQPRFTAANRFCSAA